jgi:hypothetical protein
MHTPQRTAAQERRRLHVQAGTGLAPTRSDKMPASRFTYSPNASPRPCRDACLARAPRSAPRHRSRLCFYQSLAHKRLHVQAGTGLAPTRSDKMPASRFKYSPNASPRPCRDACLARAPHSAPPHRRRLHVHAGTGLAPTHSDKMPASRFRYSPNASPRPCRDACLARAPHSAPPHRRRLHVQAGTGLAPTPSDKMPASRFTYTARMLIHDHVTMSA